MKIKIKKIARIEGHAGLAAHLFHGKIFQAKIEIQEGARLIEGLLLGRHFSDAPIITARICGICPVVHNLTSIQAIENAFKIKVKKEIILLRQLMLWAQFIHSHTLHLFFLSFPDFLNYSDELIILRKYSQQADWAMKIRNFGNQVIEQIGGRAVHPIASEVGGFKKYPNQKIIKNLFSLSKEILPIAVNLTNFFNSLNYPKFSRPTNYISLSSMKDYAVYDSGIKINLFNHNKDFIVESPDKFFTKIREQQYAGEIVRRAKYRQQVYMLGALARINNNAGKLNFLAKKVLKQSHLKRLPNYNSFYNILAQAIEVVHGIGECQKILKQLQMTNWSRVYNSKIKIAVSQGLGVHEAPRGTLWHYYEIDNQGIINNCRIVTPTAQFLNNLEEDLRVWLPEVAKLSKNEREKRIKQLIRAYDPCITCATH